jgi:DNA invertase Pin-like site-specific DNA recombinase
MPQGMLPIFPLGTTIINEILSFDQRDGMVTYFNGLMPLFTHHKDDIQTFRMILSQFYVNGSATQAELTRATGIPSITLKRAVKLYRSEGTKGFYVEPKRGGPRVLKADVVSTIECFLEQGMKENEIAKQLDIKIDTLKKAIRRGIIKKKKPLHYKCHLKK